MLWANLRHASKNKKSSGSKCKCKEKYDKSDISWKTLVEMFFLEILLSIPRKRAGKIPETNGFLKIIFICKSLECLSCSIDYVKRKAAVSLRIRHTFSCKMGESCTTSLKTVFSHPLWGFKCIKTARLITKLMRLRIPTVYNAKMPKAQWRKTERSSPCGQIAHFS